MGAADNLEASSHKPLACFDSGNSFRGKKNSGDVPAPEVLVLGLLLPILIQLPLQRDFAVGIKVANQLALKQRNYPGTPNGA